jgi:ankyrin repeat protein
LDALQHCIPPNLREYLNELPETLDETYDRILKGISKAQKNNAHRLLQCLTIAVRPLRVEELAELLAFDFQATTCGGLPTLKEDWRWDDQEEAVLSTCSSLIAIIPRDDSRVVQFSHFSVKEYLTSSRLAQSPHGEVSRFRINLEPAHTVMAQACLATLLQQDGNARNHDAKVSPLVEYAAEHWVDHAQFGKVSSRVRNGMDDLFDSSKPYFAAWVRVHDIDERWEHFGTYSRDDVGSPLYYASFCGFYDLAERLIINHPDQVNARGGRNLFPLPAALYKTHFRVANLLYRHGAVVDVQGDDECTPLLAASSHEQVDIMRWLLDHGADPNAHSSARITPLIAAADVIHLEAVQVLLEHRVDINLQDIYGETALYSVLMDCGSEGKVVEIVRRLLEHGADPNIRNKKHKTPLHRASSLGWLEAARLLLSYGAKVDERDEEGKTPFQWAASKGRDDITKLLVEHGAVPPNQS